MQIRTIVTDAITGPSYKRGPPKGYIHAIEQRWHQVECVLATVLALPRAQDIVADLRQDDFARDILDRVGSGPYVRLPRQPPEITLIYARNSLGKRRKSYPKCNGPWRGRILQCHHGPVSLRRQTHKTPVEANTRIRVQSRHVSTSLTFIHPEPPETLHSISRILNSVHPELTLNW